MEVHSARVQIVLGSMHLYDTYVTCTLLLKHLKEKQLPNWQQLQIEVTFANLCLGPQGI